MHPRKFNDDVQRLLHTRLVDYAKRKPFLDTDNS